MMLTNEIEHYICNSEIILKLVKQVCNNKLAVMQRIIYRN